MSNAGTYHDFVREVFTRETAKALSKGYGTLLETEDNPYLRRALATVGDECASPDDLAAGLTKFANQLLEEEVRFRGKPEWQDADSDEAAPLFRDDCAPGFRDDLAPCFIGVCRQ